jgi:hypothetical protein
LAKFVYCRCLCVWLCRLQHELLQNLEAPLVRGEDRASSSVNDSIHPRRYSKMLRIEPDMGVAADHAERPEIKLHAAQAYWMASATMSSGARWRRWSSNIAGLLKTPGLSHFESWRGNESKCRITDRRQRILGRRRQRDTNVLPLTPVRGADNAQIHVTASRTLSDTTHAGDPLS